MIAARLRESDAPLQIVVRSRIRCRKRHLRPLVEERKARPEGSASCSPSSRRRRLSASACAPSPANAQASTKPSAPWPSVGTGPRAMLSAVASTPAEDAPRATQNSHPSSGAHDAFGPARAPCSSVRQEDCRAPSRATRPSHHAARSGPVARSNRPRRCGVPRLRRCSDAAAGRSTRTAAPFRGR